MISCPEDKQEDCLVDNLEHISTLQDSMKFYLSERMSKLQ